MSEKRWIKVTEYLPQQFQNVWIFLGNHKLRSVSSAVYNKEREPYPFSGDGPSVSHWMPREEVPAPPEGIMAEQVNLHINRPQNPTYLPRVRRFGYQKYEVLGVPRATFQEALIDMAKMFENTRYKRGDVLLICGSGWYEPNQLVEITR